MLKKEDYFVKDLKTTFFIFEKENDFLPIHTHATDSEHITIVLSGSINCYGPSFNIILKQGDVYDFKENEQTHEIKALEDNTKILNIRKYFVEEEISEETLKEEKRLSEEWEKEQKRQIQAQLDMIKRIEEEDRARGIIPHGNTNQQG